MEVCYVVSIIETGFSGDGDDLMRQVTGSTQRFTLVLAALKVLLDHNIWLNLVADRYPKGLEDHEFGGTIHATTYKRYHARR